MSISDTKSVASVVIEQMSASIPFESKSASQSQNCTLSDGKSYIVRFKPNDKISIHRDLSQMSKSGRAKNAIVNFFGRLTTKGESGFRTRGKQMTMEVKKQVKLNESDIKSVREEASYQKLLYKLVSQALDIPLSEFDNQAKYLASGTEISTATFDNVTFSNKKRLKLDEISERSSNRIKANFPQYITAINGLFNIVADRFTKESLAIGMPPVEGTDEELESHASKITPLKNITVRLSNDGLLKINEVLGTEVKRFSGYEGYL